MVEITSVKDSVSVVPWGYKIKSKGVFNLEDLYVELNAWFLHMGYDWKEIEYKKINNPNGSYRIEVIWQGIKKVDDYSTFVITLNLGGDISDVDVQLEGGKKVKRQAAGLEFRAQADIKKDIKQFEETAFGMGNIAAKGYELLIHDRLQSQVGDLYVEAHKLFDELKAFMMVYAR